MRSPDLYGISADDKLKDPMLTKRRLDLIYSAACILEKHQLIRYDRKSGIFSSTALGKIASHYYVKFPSIAIYNEELKPYFGIIDLLRVFSMSVEFKYVPIREQERGELSKLLE